MNAKSIPELLAQARTLHTGGDPDGADQLYDQVLTLRPAHAGAWLERIELALGRGLAGQVLDLCDRAAPLCPDHRVALQSKRARALEAQGAREAALALLSDLRSDAPEDLPLAAVTAGMWHRAGELEQAEQVYRDVLTLRPDHAGAWLTVVEIALVRGNAEQALALSTEAEKHCPAHVVPLQIKRVRALEAVGQADAALALTVSLRATAPENAQLALIEARIRRKSGDLVAADAAYRDVLQRQPDHFGAWLGRIDIAQTEGDPDRAFALVVEVQAIRPGDPALIARQAGLLLHMGRPEAAIDRLTAALVEVPQEARLHLELARAMMQAGRTEEAEKRFADCLTAAPDNADVRLELAQAQAARGAPEAALATLEGHADGSLALDLKTAELLALAGQGSRLAALLDRLAAAVPRMSEAELLRLFKLGEQSDHSAAAVAVVGNVAARTALSPLIARFLLTRARVILPPETVTGVQDALESRLPASRLPEFRAFATGLLFGPEAALTRARADLPARRDTQGAVLLGERLLDAGERQIAFRYLRACVRRWPGAPRLRRQFLRAAIETGHLEAGHAWLDALEARFAGLDLGLDRMHLMVQEGRLTETRDLAETRARAGLATPPPRQFLDVALALGDVEASADLVRQVQSDPEAGRQSAAHFSTTLHGAQFNELRLFCDARDQAEATGEAPEQARARLAQDFFFPAAQIVAGHVGRLGPRPGSSTVPRRIFQYWNTPKVPEEVASLMQSWQGAAGFDHQLYDRSRAMVFLREHFGPRHARAFQLANSPAEECDFLRLCLLYRHGGIYADADDKLAGNLEALISEGPGMIVTRELWGAVANNVICAPEGHPLVLWALQSAGRSLLARENDGTWFKTGPGLMTRAVANWLGQATPAEAEAGLTILTQAQLAAHVQPHVRLSYKTSGQYWNARDRHAPQALVAAFGRLADSTRA
ncbi:tetratricopeptide repeat protein [Antarctobacter heliothermus]|uniref:Glycosyltransferase sugar-binding region containing DXD motif-containing protein n=1 Tax=Antarctobacter heliothermus TaxID=74033 RepID=A0A239HZ34_9RHOB|nr:tetratricopeptide repeat protein [Antarctobacter heliothermus]SNS85494.1 Glycosyltransferase sugar-binding region containing DXD motif-containing protein [Antarctobacter heliothermus]